MKNNWFARSLVVSVALASLFVVPVSACAQSAPTTAVQFPNAVSSGAQDLADSSPANDFAGMKYTDEQIAEIDKIHRETESNKALVARDEKLNADQKNAMIQGYTRLEYGRTFKVLSLEQQNLVRQRIAARRAANQAAQRKPPPRH